eukprot:1194139-Prorocentrum_minimum.AAC.2
MEHLLSLEDRMRTHSDRPLGLLNDKIHLLFSNVDDNQKGIQQVSEGSRGSRILQDDVPGRLQDIYIAFQVFGSVNTVDIKGNIVDVKGNNVDVKDNKLDVKGNNVDVKGPPQQAG